MKIENKIKDILNKNEQKKDDCGCETNLKEEFDFELTIIEMDDIDDTRFEDDISLESETTQRI